MKSQLSRKTSFKYTHNDAFYNSSWKDKNKFHNQDILSNSSKESTPKTSKDNLSPPITKSPTKTSIKKCFKCLGFGHIVINCPNKRTMMVKGGIVATDHSDKSSRSTSPTPSKTLSEDECEIPYEGDLLVVRRMLGTIQKPFDETQRENIFHTRCLINKKLCSMIMDGGSCANVPSTRVVEKLGLPTISHTKPYKLQWLSEEGEIMVNKQVLITFSLGKYKDEVLCDVVSMEATHILLERPWQYDRKNYMTVIPIRFLSTSKDIRLY